MALIFHGVRGFLNTPIKSEYFLNKIELIWSEFEKNNLNNDNFLTYLKKNIQVGSKSRDPIHYPIGNCSTCIEYTGKESEVLFFDAGTGLRRASLDKRSHLYSEDFQKGKGRINLFMTHSHWDHILGLLETPSLYRPGNQFHIHSVHKNMEERIEALFHKYNFPVPFDTVRYNLRFHEIPHDEPFNLGQLKITHLAQSHPGGSFAYKIEDGNQSTIFSTDTDGSSFSNMDYQNCFFTNADTVILDAQFSPDEYEDKAHIGHQDCIKACNLAHKCGVKNLYLFHFHPDYSDVKIIELLKQSQEYLKSLNSTTKVHLAIEGLMLD